MSSYLFIILGLSLGVSGFTKVDFSVVAGLFRFFKEKKCDLGFQMLGGFLDF